MYRNIVKKNEVHFVINYSLPLDQFKLSKMQYQSHSSYLIGKLVFINYINNFGWSQLLDKLVCNYEFIRISKLPIKPCFKYLRSIRSFESLVVFKAFKKLQMVEYPSTDQNRNPKGTFTSNYKKGWNRLKLTTLNYVEFRTSIMTYIYTWTSWNSIQSIN